MPKEMNRTSGTARRKINKAEEIRYAMKTGKPLTGSASGVKSITTKQAGETLTQGIVTIRNGKLQFAPEGLAMALPVGKLAKAAKALRGAGKVSKAAGLEARIFAKTEGRAIRGQVDDLNDGGDFGPTMKFLRRKRLLSENIYPKVSKYNFAGTFNRFGDMLPKATRKARGIKRVNPQAD